MLASHILNDSITANESLRYSDYEFGLSSYKCSWLQLHYSLNLITESFLKFNKIIKTVTKILFSGQDTWWELKLEGDDMTWHEYDESAVKGVTI